MKDCHESSVTHLANFLHSIPNLDYSRALEVAAGDGQLTTALLGKEYRKVDCFDQCPVGVRKLEELRQRIMSVDFIDQATM